MVKCPRCNRAHSGICGIPPRSTLHSPAPPLSKGRVDLSPYGYRKPNPLRKTSSRDLLLEARLDELHRIMEAIEEEMRRLPADSVEMPVLEEAFNSGRQEMLKILARMV